MTHTKLAADAADPSAAPASLYRWVVLAVAWLALLFAFVDRLAWANVAVQVSGSLGLPIAALGAFVTAFYVGYVAANALGGMGTDRFGPSRMLAIALIPLGLATFAFSYTTSVLMGLGIQVLMGLAAGADYAACVKLTATWFDFRMRGRAMGLLTTASSVAVTLTNAIVPSLFKWVGWTGVYQILGVITAGVGGLCILFLRDAKLPAVAAGEKPSMAALFRNRDLVLLAVIGFGALWGTWGFTFWVNALMVKGYGISAERAGFITVVFGVGAIFSKPLVGLLSDLIGGQRKAILIICFAAFTVMLLIFGGLKTETAFLIAAPFLGVTAFIYTPLLVAMVAEIAGPALVGTAYGVTNAIWQLSSVVVPVVVGVIYQQTNSLYAAFVALAIGPLVATIAMFWVKERALF
jgi:sugar phosphate permease